MLQDRRFAGMEAINNINIKPYSVGTLSTPNSPSHISLMGNNLNLVSSPTNLNSYHIQTTLPQSVISKPISVTILPQSRQFTQIQHTSTRIVNEPISNVRAIGTIGAGSGIRGNTIIQQVRQLQQIQHGQSQPLPPLSNQGSNQILSQSSGGNPSELYKRILSRQQQQNIVSFRHNNRFFGSGIPDNSKSRSRTISPVDISRSIGTSGVVQQQKQGQIVQSRQSRSVSPVIQSTTVNQSVSLSPNKNQVNFMYGGSQGPQRVAYNNQISQQRFQAQGYQQILQQPKQPQQSGGYQQSTPNQLTNISHQTQFETRQLSPNLQFPIQAPLQPQSPYSQGKTQIQFNYQSGQGQIQGANMIHSFNPSQNNQLTNTASSQSQNATNIQNQNQGLVQGHAIGQAQGQVVGSTQIQGSQGSQQLNQQQKQFQQGSQLVGQQSTQLQGSQQIQKKQGQQTQQRPQNQAGQQIQSDQKQLSHSQGTPNQIGQQAQVQHVQTQLNQGQVQQGQAQVQLSQQQIQRQMIGAGQQGGLQYIQNPQYGHQNPQYIQYGQPYGQFYQPNMGYQQYETTRIVQPIPMVPIASPVPVSVPTVYGEYPQQVHQMQHMQQQLYDPNSHQIMHVDNRTLITTTIIWEHRFIQIYSKFQTFVQRFQAIVDQIYYIDDLFDNVSDEEAWNDLRTKYSDMIDKFNEMRQEIILVLEQNKAAVNSLSPEVVQELQQKQMLQQDRDQQQGEEHQQEQHRQNRNQQEEEDQQQEVTGEEGGQTGKSGSENNHLWENRYLQLMQQYEQQAQSNVELGNQIQKLRAIMQQMQQHIEATEGEGSGEQKKARSSEHENMKIIELQRNLNTVHSEYQKLQDNYTKLSDEYSKVVSELQNIGSGDHDHAQTQIAELHQQLEMAQAKIQQLYGQSQTKDQHLANMQKEMQQYAHFYDQNKHLNQTLQKMQQSLSSYDTQLKNKDKVLEEYDLQNKGLHQKFNALSKQLSQFQQQNNQNPQQNQEHLKKIKQLDTLKKQFEDLKQKQKNLLNNVEKHQQSIEQMAAKYQQLSRQYQGTVKQKQDQIKLLNKFLEEERQAKDRAIRQSSSVETTKVESIAQSKIFKQRLQIQIQQIVADKNRKIKSLTTDLEDLKSRIDTMEKDKNKSIKQIKDFFQQEQEKYIKKLQDKDNNLRLVNQKIRSFEHQLSSRNLQISRFRHQSPVASFSSVSQQSKKYTEALDKKNYEMQQLRRTIQQKSVNIMQLEQKIVSLQQEVTGKVFQINSLKRQTYDSHGHRAELDNLNNVIKKKNQQLNQLRLTGLQLDQLRLNIDSLEREKIRLNQYLKQKTRQCESKDSTIQTLQRKITSMSFQNMGVSRKVSGDTERNATAVSLNNYQTLLRQKQNDLKNAKYQLDMLETKVQISQKTIRDLNNKVNNTQRSAAVLKAQMQNRIAKYQNQIKDINKQVRNLKANKQELTNTIESLQSKNISLQKSLDQRNRLFDKQMSVGKNKVSDVQKYNTALLTDKQILKTQNDRLLKENKQLNDKIKSLQDKIESKNVLIDQIKGNYQKKQIQDTKIYEQKIKKLDGELKLSSVRLKKMQEQIDILNRKIASAESQKRSYKERLITQHNNNDKGQFIDFRFASEHHDDHQDYIQFKLKDPQANDVFERKVIYDLKRENDLLRKQLSGAGGYNSFSMNRIDTTHHNRFSNYEQQAFTERDRFRQGKFDDSHNDQLLTYHKNKNKQLETRIDQLLRVNNQLKERISILNAGASNQMSIQFYKDEVKRLEADIAKLQAKIKQILSEHESTKDQMTGHEHLVESMKDKVGEQDSKILELKNIIRQRQETIAQLQNTKAICQQEIQRLKQLLERSQNDKDELSRKDKSINQSARKQRSLEQQIAKLTNKISIQSAEIERLNQVLKIKKNELDSRYGESNEQAKKLKIRIMDLQRQLEMLRLDHSSQISNSGELEYKLEFIRSFFIEIQTLIGELPLIDRKAQNVAQQVRNEIKQGLNAVSSISV